MFVGADSVTGVTEGQPNRVEDPTMASAADVRDRVRFEDDALAHADQLYRIALRLTGSPQSAEELVQETYLRAFRSWRSYATGSNLAAWLATILRNIYLDEARRQSRRPVIESLDEQGDYYLYNHLAETAKEPQEAVLNRLAGGAIVDSLADVPPTFREVIVLVDVGGFSYKDAAEILDVPVGTVMSRLHRGRRLLKQALAERTKEENG
jgi:RNA polymerase sigma-70 factor (ECF subfamily)